ncbi:AraC family transcriptional regulator [Microbacterium awajiense]|uniref:AraC family transcriptional regulator n=1 Tax=Microbacterium awajiense TaxID=415214 RepID=A0ABP7AK15_9MICO
MVVRSLAAVVKGNGARVVDGVRDADELAEVMTRLTRPHRIVPDARGGGLDARADVLASGGLAFTRLRYGGAIVVTPGEVDPDTYLFPLSFAGEARLTYGRATVPVTARDGALIPPYREFRSEIDAAYEQVILAVDRLRVEAAVARLTAGAHDTLDLDATSFAPRRATVRALEAVASSSSADAHEAALAERLGDVALESLLLGIPQFEAYLPRHRDAGSARVRAAMQFMLDHLAEPLTVARIAESAHVSPRALQAAFRAEVDASPTEWLRDRRLDRARQLLTSSGADLTIAEIAASCGFAHLGEFAARFRDRFGVLPSHARSSRIR